MESRTQAETLSANKMTTLFNKHRRQADRLFAMKGYPEVTNLDNLPVVLSCKEVYKDMRIKELLMDRDILV